MLNFARKWFQPTVVETLFPEIDYENHPYYVELSKQLTPEDNQKALAMFNEHYNKMLAQQKRFSEIKKDEGQLSRKLRPLANNLQEDGIVGIRLNPDTRKRMLDLTEKAAQDLIAKRLTMKPEDRGVEGVCSILCRFDNKQDSVYSFFDTLLQEHGVYDLCRDYKGIGYQMKFVVLQINQDDDAGILSTCCFEDGKRSETFYMHVDSTIEALKVIIYRSDYCDENTGAFRYLPGSYRMCDPEEFAIRKANDKSGMDTINVVERRKFFAALPKEYQKKANFGNDLITSDDRTRKLLAHEEIYGTDRGDLLLFNPDGIHRGSIFKTPGQRQIFQLLLIPVL